MKVFVVIKRTAADFAGDSLESLGVFNRIEDARKAMQDDFEGQDYNKETCEEYEIECDSIYIVGALGFSYDHYWVEIVEQEIK